MRVRPLPPLPLLLLCLSACGGDDNRNVDVRQRDAGPDRDARADAEVDAGRDAAVRDSGEAGSDEDAGLRPPPFDPADCTVIAERSERSAPVTFGDETGFSLTPGLTGFGVVYQSNNCGALSVLPVSATSEYPQPNELYADCDTVAQGVSLLHVSGGYRLVWVDNKSGSAELQALQLAEALTPPASTTRSTLSNNQVRELTPVQASIGSADFLTWISFDSVSKKRDIMLRRVDSSAEAKTLVAADADFQPTKLALAQLGQDSGALAFVSEQGNVGIWLVPLAADGTPRGGAPIQISAAVSTGNTVDLATRSEDGGAVVYSTDIDGRREVRFRRLNPQAEFLSDEVKVVTQPLQGRDASITRLGGGYVVAFRSYSEDAAERGEVRLAFVTKEGNLQRDAAGRVTTYLVAQASTTGGRVTARISQDGQLLVGFVDVSAEGGTQFRLVRKRLDCAL